MAGGDRELRLQVTRRADEQDAQVGVINGKLVASFGYNTFGVVRVLDRPDASNLTE